MGIKKGVVVEKMGESFVAYDNETSNLHELNEVAYIILSDLEKGRGKASSIRKIISKFQVEEKRARKDYDYFLTELKKKDLIVLKK